MVLPFADRAEAGRLLGERLLHEPIPRDPVVVGLPRGGVPVALQVARRLHAPLDVLIVRKIGAPGQREFAVAALAEGPRPVLEIDEVQCAAAGADAAYIERELQVQWREIERRREVYRRGRPPLDLEGRTVILVDDGIATGTTARVAIKALRSLRPAMVVLAVPLAASETLESLGRLCDRVVCLAQPQPLRAVGMHYVDFHQLSDVEVTSALDAAALAQSAAGDAAPR